MKVLKFGGSSVANAENISKVADIVASRRGERLAVVVSAMQGTTDTLIALGREAETAGRTNAEKLNELRDKLLAAAGVLLQGDREEETADLIQTSFSELQKLLDGVGLVRELSARTLDKILSFGEVLSSRILTTLLVSKGINAAWADSRLLITTDAAFGKAAVKFSETNTNISEHFTASNTQVTVLPGFIASTSNGDTTTLGRGGSDYTAAIIAAAVDAELLEIWTDVSGMMTADPRFVRNAKHIPAISYREAMELSHFGAKVIYPPTIQPVMSRGIPVLVKNTFAPGDAGTLIEQQTDDGGIIRGISSIDGIAILNLEGSGMVGIPGFSKRLFGALAAAQINVILITQSSSEHSICVAVEEKFADAAKQAVDAEFENEIAVGKIDPLRVETGFSILALVGDNMRFHTGVSGKMFSTLGSNGINIHAIAQGSSERNISAVIASSDVRKAVNVLNEEFFSDGSKQVNVFIAGVGTVGGRLLDQLHRQHDALLDDLRLNVRIAGVANSRRAAIDEDEIDAAEIDLNESGEEMDISQFTDRLIEMNLRNSVFVDVTASPQVVECYPKLLKRSISIVACNKIAASAELATYRRLKELAREYGANFFFETNVGAGLPIIHTLGDLLRSGDRVRRIEAVLSGTLNFVFNNYDGSRPFADVVRQAQDEGYTEPDPRLDLSGTDVARKILILAREAGYALEMDDIENEGFLPPSCLAGSVEDFYSELAANETHFKGLLDAAVANGKTLKYIASFADGAAKVGLQQIGPEHNFAGLSGKDNAVLFYTDRYSEQPLVVKGAGAGADVTAAGVFADIVRAVRN
ncbi:MAG: bifunctional aspartate kinase/homoserine dehydrogenase I [Acidobacteria bacterium]|nr:bifunctional aspartate kinase/homoserine dehydrogenase I [Acidobacteriota bacterium]